MIHTPKVSGLVAVSVAALIAAGCGGAAKPKPAIPLAASHSAPRPLSTPLVPAKPLVHLQTLSGVTTIGAKGRWTAAGAVATPDWATIFTVESNRLRTLDGVTGAERASQPVRPGMRPVVTSPDGLFVALTDSPARVGQGLFPAGRIHSTVVVANADPTQGAARTFQLMGNIVPEGFSTGYSSLYVIEFLPAAHPDRYRVRSLDLTSGQIGPVLTFDKTVDTEVMQGLSRTQVFSAKGPFGPMLYTLYSRAGGPGAYADLHALALDGGLVHCTDFPASLRIGPAGGAIAVSPDGQRVYVASETGTVIEVDASASSGPPTLGIVHTAQLRPGIGVNNVALTADDHRVWVALGTSLFGLDATDLHQVTATTLGQAVGALAVTQHQTLYAATSGAVEVIEPTTGLATPLATIDIAATRLAVA